MLFSLLPRWKSRQLIAASSFILLVACAEKPTAADALPLAPAQPAPVVNLPGATPDASTEIQPLQTFAQWQAGFRQQALQAGISPNTFDRAFLGVTPDLDVIKADRSQPEFSRPVWEYLEGALSPLRVRNGKKLLEQNAELLTRLEQRYGVDRQVLVSVWGMESNFGQFQGSKSVIRSLATLAYEGRRPQFAQDQLIAALQILQNGDIQPEAMRGSWAGAMGQTQFIPTTYNTHAVDFDGDGRRDIWNSTPDALASTAHYLQSSGWKRGQPWGFEVQVPANSNQLSAALLLPAGARGPAFLVLDNFRAILKYNNSSSYALAVSLLGDRFSGWGFIAGSWPKEDLPLSRSERMELQHLLNASGHDAGNADGIIGANTRKAIRTAQQGLGWPADGYPTHKLLESLRQR